MAGLWLSFSRSTRTKDQLRFDDLPGIVWMVPYGKRRDGSLMSAAWISHCPAVRKMQSAAQVRRTGKNPIDAFRWAVHSPAPSGGLESDEPRVFGGTSPASRIQDHCVAMRIRNPFPAAAELVVSPVWDVVEAEGGLASPVPHQRRIGMPRWGSPAASTAKSAQNRTDPSGCRVARSSPLLRCSGDRSDRRQSSCPRQQGRYSPTSRGDCPWRRAILPRNPTQNRRHGLSGEQFRRAGVQGRGGPRYSGVPTSSSMFFSVPKGWKRLAATAALLCYGALRQYGASFAYGPSNPMSIDEDHLPEGAPA